MNRILVLGGSFSGKTHFGAQLYARMSDPKSVLKLRETPANIGIFDAVLQRLGKGMASEHTPRTQYGEIVLPVITNDRKLANLIWPDYGGEQIDELIDKRQVSEKWRMRIEDSDSWALLIRLQHAGPVDDVLTRPLEIPENGQRTNPARWSVQARLVELLQILRFVKGCNGLHSSPRPRLLVLLSCWDELHIPAETPATKVLSSQLPFVDAFVRSYWPTEGLRIYGISALGKSLRSDAPDEEYQDRGPEAFGFVITPDGQQSSDLTLPVMDLI